MKGLVVGLGIAVLVIAFIIVLMLMVCTTPPYNEGPMCAPLKPLIDFMSTITG